MRVVLRVCLSVGHLAAKGRKAMAKPVIFTISAAWDDEASVWSGHCDDIPAAADAPTLDELFAKCRRWRSTSCPTITRRSIRAQAICRSRHCARPSPRSPEWPRSSIARCAISCARRAARSCVRARQPRGLAQPDHAAELCGPDRHPKPPHRQCYSAPSRPAEGVLRLRRLLHPAPSFRAITPWWRRRPPRGWRFRWA
jgi:Domain of unknown function (DUF1902)